VAGCLAALPGVVGGLGAGIPGCAPQTWPTLLGASVAGPGSNGPTVMSDACAGPGGNDIERPTSGAV
jgi:hypothetical protein